MTCDMSEGILLFSRYYASFFTRNTYLIPNTTLSAEIPLLSFSYTMAYILFHLSRNLALGHPLFWFHSALLLPLLVIILSSNWVSFYLFQNEALSLTCSPTSPAERGLKQPPPAMFGKDPAVDAKHPTGKNQLSNNDSPFQPFSGLIVETQARWMVWVRILAKLSFLSRCHDSRHHALGEIFRLWCLCNIWPTVGKKTLSIKEWTSEGREGVITLGKNLRPSSAEPCWS